MTTAENIHQLISRLNLTKLHRPQLVIIREITFNCKILDKIVASSRRIELDVWNGNNAQTWLAWRGGKWRRWNISAGAGLIRRCQYVWCWSMFAASSWCSYHSPVQNLIIVIIIVSRHFVFFTERAAHIGIENVVADICVHGTARVGANDDVYVFWSVSINEWWINVVIWCLLIKAKESTKT